MAALWPSLMWPPVLEAFYHAKTGVQKDFTMKHCLGEIMGGKAHKMIIQYVRAVCKHMNYSTLAKSHMPAQNVTRHSHLRGI